MPDDLYHRGILAWSRAQAGRLRRVAAGERVNDVDWANAIEEIGSVGRSEVQAVASFLLQALLHAMEVAAWPDHMAARKWRNEIGTFLLGARRRFAPGMAQQLDIAATTGMRAVWCSTSTCAARLCPCRRRRISPSPS